MFSVGLDVGDTRSSVEILDPNGKRVNGFEVKGRWPLLLARIQQDVPQPFAVCFEASNGYGYLYEQLSKHAQRVAVAHPGQLRLIFKSKKKHNRVDAQKLAKLLYLDEVPSVYVPTADVRTWRGSIEYRQRLLQKRCATKNQIHALLKSQGIQTPAEQIKSLWTRKGIAWLKGLELDESLALRRDLMIDELEQAGRRIRLVNKHLKKVADKHPAVALLMTIPGVGIRTAEAFVAYIDDVRRFARVKQVGSYLGLVPSQDASGDVNRLGHITREGPPTVRKLLSEAAWQGIRRSKTIRSFFEQVKHDDPQRKKIALVATAHYLVRVVTAMLRSGECWREKPELSSPLRKTPDA